MIVASLLLVIAAAVTLLIGLFNRPDIEWVYASIACCLLAGLLLTIGVLRSRPSRKPVLQSGGQGQASWAGASPWGGAAGEGNSGTGSTVLTRDDEDDQADTAALQGNDEPTYTSMPTAPAEDAEASPWTPEDEEDTADVRVVPPPAAEEPAAPPAPPAPEPEQEDVVVVPKPSSRNGAPAEDSGAGMAAGQAAAAASAATGEVTDVTASPAARALKDSSEDAARFEQVLSPIAGVGPAKRQAIYQHFGTYRKLRAASPEKLAEVPGVSRTLADRIHQALHSK